MYKNANKWQKTLEVLLHRSHLSDLIRRDTTGEKFIRQCKLNLTTVTPDKYLLRNPDLPTRVKRQMKSLARTIRPALIQPDKERLAEIERWFQSQANSMRDYLEFEKGFISRTKPRERVLLAQIAYLFSFCRSNGFSEKETVAKVYRHLFDAGIVSKPFSDLTPQEAGNQKKIFLRAVSVTLKKANNRIVKEKIPSTSKRAIIAQLRREGFSFEKKR